MNLLTILLIILVIAAIIFTALYFFGKKIEKRNAQNQEAMEAASQNYKILVIDKKKMKLKEAGLPKIVIEQTPKYLRRSKVPVVKVKVGPKITTMIADPKIFDVIPVKQEVMATISGIYITSVRGKLLPKPEKLTFKQKIKNKFKRK